MMSKVTTTVSSRSLAAILSANFGCHRLKITTGHGAVKGSWSNYPQTRDAGVVDQRTQSDN